MTYLGKMMMSLKHAFVALILSAFSACAISCGGNSDGRPRTQAQLMQFIRFNDSIITVNADAAEMCDSMMAAAPDSLTYYEYYILKGRHLLQTDNPDSAVRMAWRTRTFARRQQPTKRTLALEALANSTEAGYCHLLRLDAAKAIALNTAAFEQIMSSDLIYYSPEMAANLADAYIAADDLPSGAKWYRKALLLVDSLNLPEWKNTTLYMGLGQIYTTMQDYETARLYYEKSEELFDQMKPNMQSYFLNNFGNYFYYRHDYSSALKMFRRLQAHLKDTGAENTYDMYLCSVNMADIFLSLGMADSAECYVDKAAGYFEKNNVQAGVYYANTIKIGIALKRRDFASVRRILGSERSEVPYVQSLKNIRSGYLQEYFVQTGDFKSAYRNLKDNLAQNDSLEHNRTHMRASEIMLRFTEDTLKLHHQLEINKKDVQVSKSRAAITISTSITLSMAVLIVCGFIVSRKRKIQTRMEMLTLKLNNTRQRISPHFVSNVLNARIGSADNNDPDTLMRLARLIRANLDMTAKPCVTLKEELDFITDYIKLEKILVGEDFDCCISAPDKETLESVHIPAMFIQILVENAIKHGIKNNPGRKRLDVEIECTSAGTTIAVTDNGPGFNITRNGNNRSKNGLRIINHTIAIVNQENKGAEKMTFSIGNVGDADGRPHGCRAVISIPRNIKFI